MARNPTFNLKTGADSDLIVAREVTQSNDANIGKIKRKDGIYTFPYLTRRTGDTLTGTTENIESNELRHGRTRSAPRKGTSSSSGDINFEFSAETFDDMMEAAFRGKWRPWTSDTDSPSNKEAGKTYNPGYFATKCATTDAGKLLIGNTADALIRVSNPSDFVVHELNSETDDIKYSLLRKYGGQTGEDLWQEFTHMAVNNMQLSVEINSIITGSFGFMGTNNPKLLNSDEAYKNFEGRMADIADNDNLVDRGVFSTSATYAVGDMVVYATDGKCYKCHTAVSVAGAWTGNTNWSELQSYEYFEAIPDHATDTMQFTAREGFLYINGKQIEFAQSLSFNLDNGLTQKFAIFVPNAISTVPLALDVTGDLSTYVVGGESDAKKLFNDAIDNEDIELLFCLQDKLEDPTALYVFQIFKAKHTENTINGNGEDTFDETLPWQSYGEQACRVFRLDIPKVNDVEFAPDSAVTGTGTISVIPNIGITGSTLDSAMSVTDTLKDSNGTTVGTANTYTSTDVTCVDGVITIPASAFATTTNAVTREIKVTYKGVETVKNFDVTDSSAPAKVTNAFVSAKKLSNGDVKTTALWTDPVSDLNHIEIVVERENGEVVDDKNVNKGTQKYETSALNKDVVYVVNINSVDDAGNKNEEEVTFKFVESIADVPDDFAATNSSGTITAACSAVGADCKMKLALLDSNNKVVEVVNVADASTDVSQDFSGSYTTGTYSVRAFVYKTVNSVDSYGAWKSVPVTVAP